MSYLVIARKYRPQGFTSVVGQEHVTRTLKNSIVRKKVSHALVLTGPRGVGKTSISRIFAKALNCPKAETTGDPCMECETCVAITKGTSLAVREIDGASHNSVDDVRDLIESFRTMPPAGYKAKVYIIDEVHMLSASAFNALLKSLEEPPPNTYFVLATTEVHKIPDTVMSRCQRHDFRALDGEIILNKLKEISKTEGLTFEDEALSIVTRSAEGSMRDAETLFDRVQSFCSGAITTKDVTELLGLAGKDALVNLFDAILQQNSSSGLKILADILSGGRDVAILMKEFIEHARELTYASVGGAEALKVIGVSDVESVKVLRQANSASKEKVLKLYDEARVSCDIAIRSSYPRYGFEALIVKLSSLGDAVEHITQEKSNIQKQEAVVKPIATEPKQESKSNKPASASGKLNFAEFLSFASSAKFIQESLKRLSVDEFKVSDTGFGILVGEGPQFLVSSFQQKATSDKLKSLLADFTKTSPNNWTLKLNAINEKVLSAPGSIAYTEEEAKKKKQQVREDELKNHPKFMELKSVLPGVEIDKISLKD